MSQSLSSCQLVVGDVHDNLAAYDLSVAEFMNGRVREGVRRLVALRNYILEGRDPASRRVLLPAINAKLAEVANSRKVSARQKQLVTKKAA